MRCVCVFLLLLSLLLLFNIDVSDYERSVGFEVPFYVLNGAGIVHGANFWCDVA